MSDESHDKTPGEEVRRLIERIFALLEGTTEIIAGATIAAVAVGFIGDEGLSREEQTTRKETLFAMIEEGVALDSGEPPP